MAVAVIRKANIMKTMRCIACFHHDSVRDEPAPYPGVSSEFTKEMRFILPEEVPT